MFDHQNITIKKDNFSRLTLSQTKKCSYSNTPSRSRSQKCVDENSLQNSLSKKVHNMSPEKNNVIKVKDISQLIPNTTNNILENVNIIDNRIKLDGKNNNDNDSKEKIEDNIIITLSTDDESFHTYTQSKSIKKKRKRRKNSILDTPEKKDIKRKLTNNTNLKTFSAKDQPDNQTKLEKFFTITQNPKSIKYFDTFEKSNKAEINETENVLDCIELIMDDIENGSAIHLKSIEDTNHSKLLKSTSSNILDSVSKHYQFKKKITNNLNKVENGLENFPEKVENNLLNKVITSESQNSFGSETMKTTNIYNSDCQSRLDSTESIVFHYNSIPSDKSESVIYSLAEDTAVRVSSRLNSNCTIANINNSDHINDAFDKVLSKNKVRKSLSFQASTTIKKIESSKEDLIQSPTIIKLPNVIISSSEQSSAISKNTNSTISNNTSNSVFDIEQYKYDSYNCPIIIDDNDSEHNNTSIKLGKLSKSKSKLKKNTPKLQTDKKTLNTRRKRILQCPSYKVIDGTTFAVDGFRFGEIDGVTHYFLTHFHGDHYIGLKKNFSMPIYMSKITATLVLSFIKVNSDFLHIINPNESKIINDIEVTSLDANHCPGAVMFVFKFPTGKCILHTGDFRACPEMESESYFWNNNIDTIYLDTTYLHRNYDFKSQSDSIMDLRYYIEEFCEKHIGQNILFVCGSYVIGKEKVWSELATLTKHRVYTDGNRRKALTAIADPALLKHLIDDPNEANIHVVTMNEVNYLKLYDYYQLYSDRFDVVLGIRPSGWETHTKPRFSGIINVIGIEYSEHSSYSELRRFCSFLQPKSIISTVPINNNDMSTTAKIPKNWFNNILQPRQQAYQPTIRSYISSTLKKPSTNLIDDQQPTCSKYLKQNDYCSDYGMLDATKSTIEICSPANSKLDNRLTTKEFTNVKSIDKLSEPLDDWMS